MMNRLVILMLAILFIPVSAQAKYKKFHVPIEYFETEGTNPFVNKLPVIKAPEPVKPVVKPAPTPRQPSVRDRMQNAFNQRVNPVQPPAPVEFPALEITGIIWESNRPQAIINQQVVDIGDKVAGVTVKAISKEGIDLEFNGMAKTIKP